MAVVSGQVEIMSPADMFYGFLKDKLPQLPQLFPGIYKSFKILEGNEIRDGSVIWIEYEHGSKMTVTERLEMNESSKSMNFIVIDGDVLKHYSSCKLKIQVNTGNVEVAIEFEKATEDSPDLGSYIDLLSAVLIQLDALILGSA
ncbi:hypothetical protein CDL15_Pgr020214 [Punica granatum]|nr:hypothetical protein CDL15_Pgr020214 [Punica granatum]PKI51490.1 hypothetical protein CRG98_028050 [Punica granatum]